MGEQLLCKQKVRGSSPRLSTNLTSEVSMTPLLGTKTDMTTGFTTEELAGYPQTPQQAQRRHKAKGHKLNTANMSIGFEGHVTWETCTTVACVAARLNIARKQARR